MKDEIKKIPALFYRTSGGAEPVRDWLKSMTKEDRLRIGADIKTVEYGWPIGMPVCRPLGRGLHEVRTHLRTGIARVLFFVADARMVLVHGFLKKTQAVPQADLKLALDRKHGWEHSL